MGKLLHFINTERRSRFEAKLTSLDSDRMDSLDQRIEKLTRDVDRFCAEKHISRTELERRDTTSLGAEWRLAQDALHLVRYLEYLKDNSFTRL